MRSTRETIVLTLGLALALMLVREWLPPTRAAGITVTTTTDVLDAAGGCGAVTVASLPGPDGVTSLREAMCAANNNPGADTIQFAIPRCDSGCTIEPTIALPVLTDDGTTIDGYTQAGASPASDTAPATLLVELDGSSIANNNGFNIISRGNVIRGLVINRFPGNGVAVGASEATGNVIAGNHIGTDPSGSSALRNGLNGVFIGLGAQNNTVGGDEPSERNIISGNGWEGVGIHGSETVSNTVSGNYIGTDATGTSSVSNELHGVRIYGGSRDNTIGGSTPGRRNVISGNAQQGVRIMGDGTTGNAVSGNYIGVDTSGLTALENGTGGVMIAEGAQGNLVGGWDRGMRNVIAGNGGTGVSLLDTGTTNNRVSANYIGVDATGLTALANSSSGVMIYSNAEENLIGGDSEGERNIISGNGINGIFVDSDHNEIVGNYVGLDASGLAALPNESDGTRILGSDNTIGGETEAEVNFIAGNEYGIWIEGPGATGNWIHGNVIGMASDGRPLGNTDDGVHLLAAQQNTVGPDNYIAYNGGDGVAADTPTAIGNAITENYIFANDGLGIHLTNGAHDGIAAPVISSAPSGPGDITGTACPGCTVEVFVNQDDDGEGLLHWGSAVAGVGGDFALPISFLLFPYLTATATDPDDGTSEFSAVFTAEIPVLHADSEKSVDRETASPGQALTYTLTVANTGFSEATATLTDTLPAEVTWADSASASSGHLTWESENNRLLWNGTVGLSSPVVIAYQVELKAGLSNGDTISNEARVNDGAGIVFEITAPDVTVVAHYVYLPLVMR